MLFNSAQLAFAGSQHGLPMRTQKRWVLEGFDGVFAGALGEVELGVDESFVGIVGEGEGLQVGRDDFGVASGPEVVALRADGVGEDVMDLVFERARGDAVAAVAFGFGNREGIEAGVWMKKNLRAEHDGEADEFGIAAFMADDRCAENAVDFEEGDGVAGLKIFRVARREMNFVVAKNLAALAIENEEGVEKFFVDEGGGAEEDVNFVLARDGGDCFQCLFEVAAVDLGEVDVVASRRAFGKEDGVAIFASGFLNEAANRCEVFGNGRAKFYLRGGDR